MRKLKLQMQITVDGFVAGPDGQLDWMTWGEDEKLVGFINHLVDTSDTILMGRKMTRGFVNYWEGVKSDDPQYDFAQKMVNTPKVVFSRTVSSMEGKNVLVENGDVRRRGQQPQEPERERLASSTAEPHSSLRSSSIVLIDELSLFVNPIAINDGLRIFGARTPLQLVDSVAYENGKVVNTYKPRD